MTSRKVRRKTEKSGSKSQFFVLIPAQKHEEKESIFIAEHHSLERHSEFEHSRPSNRLVGWDWHKMSLYILVPV